MNSSKWSELKVGEFWGENAPCSHVVQFYETENIFIELLTQFVLDGLQRDETIVIIATEEHVTLLTERLQREGTDLFGLQVREQLIIEDARQTLSSFMVGAHPDEILFRHVIGDLVAKASKRKRPIRAFGEMVVLLWDAGLTDATLELEHLWNDLQQTQAFLLFCAYPRKSFVNNSAAILNICGTHSKIVAPTDNSAKSILYKDLSFNKTH
jgi:hypothetical protein